MVKIKICPKCKKAKLKMALNVSGWLAPDMYTCKNCNYTGPIYIEIDSEDYKITEENDTTEKNDQ